MKGLPVYLQTRSDWKHAYEYALMHPDARDEFISRLAALKASKTMKTLKQGVSKPAEELVAEDFAEEPDPASPFMQVGFSDQEVDEMISNLKRRE